MAAIDEIFCVKFQRFALKLHAKYLSYTYIEYFFKLDCLDLQAQKHV